MANYIDGFIVPVKKAKINEYKKMARLARKIWLEHGALDYVESMADDVPYGKRTSFPRAVKAPQDGDEVVFFSFIVFKSRKERDRINKLAMSDKRFDKMDMKNMPFDGKRMIYGGFKVAVSA